jgi:hypothetical protein
MSIADYIAEVLGTIQSRGELSPSSRRVNTTARNTVNQTEQLNTYDHKWVLIPVYNGTEQKLYLLNGSGNVITCKLELEENATSINATIPKVVGVGKLVGTFSIETVAQGANSTYTNLNANLKGVGTRGIHHHVSRRTV